MRMAVPFITLALMAGSALPAAAVEYRLQVVSLYEESFAHFLDPGSVRDGSSSPGLDRLETTMDRAELPKGALVYDRPLHAAGEATAQAFGAVRIRGEVRPAGDGREQWTEVRWEGKPGERSVWIVGGVSPHFQEVRHLALKGNGSLRYFIPHGANARGAEALRLPLMWVQFWEARGGFWERHLSRLVNLGSGIAAVVGENDNPLFADFVYILVNHAAQPATYKAVLGWRRRSPDFSNKEGAGNNLMK